MEHAQHNLMIVLLNIVYDQGFLSKTTYLGAMDLVHSMTSTPSFFRHPMRTAKEAGQHGHT